MKHLIIAIFVLVCSYAVSSHSDTIAPQLTMGSVVDLTHHLAKRQTPPSNSIQDLLDCTITVLDYQCGSSGYAQRIADIALSCRNDSYARGTASSCARSESGDFCGSATFRFILDQSLAADASTCSAATASSCPSTCRRFLESASSRLGCCINTFINTTFNPLAALYSTYVDYRLWNYCNVPLPAADCGNGLPLNPPQDAQDCTLQELFVRLANHACTPSVGQPLVDTLLQNSKCYTAARQLVDSCLTNANNEYCAAIIGSDVLSPIISNEGSDPLITSLALNCNSSFSSSCSASCRSAINNVKTSYGCCVNVINETTGSSVSGLSYSVWNSCGIDTPGVCTTSSLSGAANMKAFAWMIILALVIHMV